MYINSQPSISEIISHPQGRAIAGATSIVVATLWFITSEVNSWNDSHKEWRKSGVYIDMASCGIFWGHFWWQFQVMDDTDLVGVNAAWEDFWLQAEICQPFQNICLKKHSTKVRMKIEGFVLIGLGLLRVCEYEILILVSLTLFLNLVAQLSFVYISLPFFPVIYKSLSFKPPWRGGAVPRVPPYALQRYKHGIGEVASGLILVGVCQVKIYTFN